MSPKVALPFWNPWLPKHVQSWELRPIHYTRSWDQYNIHVLNKVWYTFGRESRYDSGTSISAKELLLMAMAAFKIWFAQSRLCCSCFFVLSWRPPGGIRGTGSHHFSSRRWKAALKEAEPSQSGAAIPCSTYQNSGSLKLSRISCQQILLLDNRSPPLPSPTPIELML
jgi:hypothetical protein